MQRVQQAVATAGVPAAVPFVQRLGPLAQLFAAVGTPHHVALQFLAGPPQRYRDSGDEWLLDPDRAGGGVMLNLGVHFIDAFLHYCADGKPVNVLAGNLRNVEPGLRVDDHFSALLRTHHGTIGYLEASYTYPSTTTRYVNAHGNTEIVTGGSTRNLRLDPDSNNYYAPFVDAVYTTFGDGFAGLPTLDDLVNVRQITAPSERPISTSRPNGRTRHGPQEFLTAHYRQRGTIGDVDSNSRRKTGAQARRRLARTRVRERRRDRHDAYRRDLRLGSQPIRGRHREVRARPRRLRRHHRSRPQRGADPHRRTRVIVEPNIPCGKCPACQTGRTSGCPNRNIVGGNLPGLLRQRAAIPATHAHPLPDSITDAQGACIEPLAVARAAARRAAVPAGDRCLVIGAGSQGLLMSMFLKTDGALPVVTDIHDGRLALAEDLGAEILNGAETFGHVFETSGVAAALRNAIQHTTAFTQITLLGISDAALGLSLKTIVRRQLRILGSPIYDHPTDFADTIALVADGQVQPDHAIKAEYSFDDVAAAFAAARQVPGKTVIHI